MAYDEDRQQVRKKNGPRVMATLRNFAISLLRLNHYQNIAKALRYRVTHISLAFSIIGLRC
jgi:inner membrane protein involved in colicin E2 resistance